MAFCRAKTWFSRSFSSLSSNPLRVGVVGSGPAGFYTAEKMLKAHQGAEIDIVDRLPTPFGLVRSGVAPDHPETKVVLAYGAESDRVLGIPGEDFAGIHSAREFVWWYNGHPDCKNLDPDLKSTDTAVILGQGNVALDVARILLRPTMELAKTDIASHALAALEGSSIRKVYLVGRRGPVQAACTAKELREILGIKDLNVHIQESDLLKSPADEEELKNNRIQRRVYELLSKAASGPSLPVQVNGNCTLFSSGNQIGFWIQVTEMAMLQVCAVRRQFLKVIISSLTISANASAIGIVHIILNASYQNTDESVGSGKQIAVGTGQFEDLECGIVLKSIGYKSVPINGLPFDHHKGIVPNIQGRVLSNTTGNPTLVEEGLYVCGWLKRGPTGIIATNLYCAEETVASISEDLEQGKLPSTSSLPKPGREGLLQLLAERNVRVLSFSTWEKIDSEEKRLGSLRNKPREKLTTREELLKVTME
ncbi:NADPH:adrenodoxin oxidoreductase, mitochondrial [Vitis vinifera]|uniref:NADPH:adrenodoxin oxidoreductase, mitochondrial n=1 Tax=Vitis vinifera TaxID=29760 RepID=A0A438IHU8_VITVI|nr:NADPH:adrenodoxin oxidoreductase, mitochondrial [Vitis vinifera]